jgi:hypothetical protein
MNTINNAVIILQARHTVTIELTRESGKLRFGTTSSMPLADCSTQATADILPEPAKLLAATRTDRLLKNIQKGLANGVPTLVWA